MFTTDYRKEGEHVLEFLHSPFRKGVDRKRISDPCFLWHFCKRIHHESFCEKLSVECIYAEMVVNEVCYLALFKELSREKSRKEALLSIEKELLKMCMDKEMVFSFFHRLPPEILSLYQMDDKTCVEYHTSPEAKVTLVYALDTGLGRALEYKTEPLKNVYEGIFTKPFTMFYGETLHYYFSEECNGQNQKNARAGTWNE